MGLVALPLTAVPFIAYAQFTPEGRLVRDRALVALAPPSLPDLSPKQEAAAVAAAPHYQGAVMALAYHGIGSSSDGEGGFVISVKRFGEHLATLKAAGMRVVTAGDVAAAFTGGPSLPPNAVMISFDDGRADAMMFADPLLAEAGMSATMFVIAGAASKPGVYYASWDRISTYARSGRWDIQSHTTASHREHKAAGGERLPMLSSLAPGESLNEYRVRIREDLAKASGAIQEHTGRRPVAFAYPFGAYGADRTNDFAVAAVLREEVARRYAVAFQQDDQLTVPLLTAEQDLLRLRRLEVQNWSGVELLQRIDKAHRQSSPSSAGTSPDGQVGADLAAGMPTSPGTDSGAPSPAAGGLVLSAPQAAQSPAPAVNLTAATGPASGAPSQTGVTSPPVTSPPATSTPGPVVTSPPTTRPPTTSAPTTAPPPTSPSTTAPPTTVCKIAGKSGKCAPGPVGGSALLLAGGA